jgi:hypothetical protein
MDETIKTDLAFELGVKAGIKIMMNKIQNHCKNRKPVTANGELFWLTDSRQHLQEVMNSMGEETEESENE